MQKANDEIIFIIISIIIFLIFLGVMFMVTLVYYNNKKRRMKREKEEMKKIYEQTLLESQIEIQEQTLRHISQEIHDNIGQILSLVSLNVSSIVTVDLEKRAFTRELLSKAMNDLRGLSKSLNPERIMMVELEVAIKNELEKLERSGDYKTELIIKNKISIVNENNKIILFRMIQEIMNNVIKHAKATQIKITFDTDDSQDFLTIEDNGIGFDILKLNNNGIGLSNIEKRSQMINATVNIESELNKGTAITFIIKK
ncbi:MAG: ATP-binding protein [Pelobium sp.]